MDVNNKSYYECKRCFIKFYQRIDMIRHLAKQKRCTRILESFNYKDDEIDEYSLQRMNKKEKKKYLCSYCNKEYKNNATLKKHIITVCKVNIYDHIEKENSECIDDDIEEDVDESTDENENYKNNKQNEDDKDNNIKFSEIKNLNNNSHIQQNIINTQNINNNTQNINNPNINIIDKNYMNNNITINNNISINFNIAKDFKEDWDTSKIDDKLKLLLLNNTYKFTKTLENILDNEVNLNVLIDNTSNYGFVFTNNSLKKMEVDDILKKSMEKIYNQLNQFKNELVDNNNLQLNEKAITNLEEQMKEAKDKYDDYRRIKDKNEAVNDIIKNIYNNKKEDTVKGLNKSIKKLEGY